MPIDEVGGHILGRILLGVCRLFWFIIFDLMIYELFWYIGWLVCRCISVNRWPKQKMHEDGKNNTGTRVLVTIVGFLTSLFVPLLVIINFT